MDGGGGTKHPLQQDVVIDIGNAGDGMMENNSALVLPPSPPLTQAGSDESLRSRAKMEAESAGDMSTWAVKSYRLDGDGDEDDSDHAAAGGDLSFREGGPSSVSAVETGSASSPIRTPRALAVDIAALTRGITTKQGGRAQGEVVVVDAALPDALLTRCSARRRRSLGISWNRDGKQR